MHQRFIVQLTQKWIHEKNVYFGKHCRQVIASINHLINRISHKQKKPSWLFNELTRLPFHTDLDDWWFNFYFNLNIYKVNYIDKRLLNSCQQWVECKKRKHLKFKQKIGLKLMNPLWSHVITQLTVLFCWLDYIWK